MPVKKMGENSLVTFGQTLTYTIPNGWSKIYRLNTGVVFNRGVCGDFMTKHSEMNGGGGGRGWLHMDKYGTQYAGG